MNSLDPSSAADATRSRAMLVAALLLVVGLALLKALAGDVLTFTSAFAVPVMIAAWYAGELAAGGIAALAALAYLVEDGWIWPVRPFVAVAFNAAVQLAVAALTIGLVRWFRAERSAAVERADGLDAVLDSVRTLRGTWSLCTCGRVRPEGGATWERLDVVVSAHTRAGFAHSLCPDCARTPT